MTKFKGVSLLHGIDEGWEWNIVSEVNRKGSFEQKGAIRYQERRGYRGVYKDKEVFYKVKLPKGANRHHVVYNDSDPNYGIIFCTPKYHAEIHKLGHNKVITVR